MNKNIKAVIFDLDGVLVSTDEQHFQAWRTIAEEEGIAFSREDNEKLRGVSRMESLELLLGGKSAGYTLKQKHKIAKRKNEYYQKCLSQLSASDILPGVCQLLHSLRQSQIALAVGSSSKNAKTILDRVELTNYFDIIITGNDIQHSKPDPEVYMLAAHRLGISAAECIVVEDAVAGVNAARAAGMRTLGVGSTCGVATIYRKDLRGLDYSSLCRLFSAEDA